MPSPVLIIYKKGFLIKAQLADFLLSFFQQKNNASCLLGLKSIVSRAGYLTASKPHSYISDMADDYLRSHELLMDYMNKSARGDEMLSTGNNV